MLIRPRAARFASGFRDSEKRLDDARSVTIGRADHMDQPQTRSVGDRYLGAPQGRIYRRA